MFKSGTSPTLHGQLAQSSLGESVNLDDVYDSTTDHFTGQSVITGSTQPLTVTGIVVKNFYHRGIATTEMCVCLSVTLCHCIKTNIYRYDFCTDGQPKDSSFADIRFIPKSERLHLERGR